MTRSTSVPLGPARRGQSQQPRQRCMAAPVEAETLVGRASELCSIPRVRTSSLPCAAIEAGGCCPASEDATVQSLRCEAARAERHRRLQDFRLRCQRRVAGRRALERSLAATAAAVEAPRVHAGACGGSSRGNGNGFSAHAGQVRLLEALLAACGGDRQKAFRRLDVNGTGVVSLSELEAGLLRLHLDWRRIIGTMGSGVSLCGIMKGLDRNGMGCYSLHELFGVLPPTSSNDGCADQRRPFVAWRGHSSPMKHDGDGEASVAGSGENDLRMIQPPSAPVVRDYRNTNDLRMVKPPSTPLVCDHGTDIDGIDVRMMQPLVAPRIRDVESCAKSEIQVLQFPPEESHIADNSGKAAPRTIPNVQGIDGRRRDNELRMVQPPCAPQTRLNGDTCDAVELQTTSATPPNQQQRQSQEQAQDSQHQLKHGQEQEQEVKTQQQQHQQQQHEQQEQQEQLCMHGGLDVSAAEDCESRALLGPAGASASEIAKVSSCSVSACGVSATSGANADTSARTTAGLLGLVLRAYAKRKRTPPELCACLQHPSGPMPSEGSDGKFILPPAWETYVQRLPLPSTHARNCEFSGGITRLQRQVLMLLWEMRAA